MKPRYDPADVVRVGGRLRVPSRVTVEADEPDLPYAVTLELALDGDRLVCEALTARRRDGGSPVVGEELRKIPVARLLRAVAPAVVWFEVGESQVEPAWRILHHHHAPPTDEGPTRQALAYLALVYELAVLTGAPPTRSVADALGIAESTARRWVRRARDTGALTVPAPRQPGSKE
jgi:hypothetical protein